MIQAFVLDIKSFDIFILSFIFEFKLPIQEQLTITSLDDS